MPKRYSKYSLRAGDKETWSCSNLRRRPSAFVIWRMHRHDETPPIRSTPSRIGHSSLHSNQKEKSLGRDATRPSDDVTRQAWRVFQHPPHGVRGPDAQKFRATSDPPQTPDCSPREAAEQETGHKREATHHICQNHRLKNPVRRSLPFPIARSSGVLAREDV